MPFAALDDQFHSNPKVIRAGFAAAGLYARALSYCAAFLTDGFVPEGWVRGMCSDHRDKHLPRALMRVEMWESCEGGYRIPDYLDYNPSREDVEKRRRDRAEAGRRGAMRRWGNLAETPSDNTSHSTSYSKGHSTSHGKGMAAPRPYADAPLPLKNKGLNKPWNDRPRYVCNRCAGLELKTQAQLDDHLRNVHDIGAVAEPEVTVEKDVPF